MTSSQISDLLPKEWDDNDRMNVMFSPFRPKSLDPVAWESKMKFWENLIRNYCLAYKTPLFTVAALKQIFSRNGKTPSCLDTVIEELLKLGTVTLASDYNNYSLSSESLVSWFVTSVLKSPLDWTLKRLKTQFMQAQVDLGSTTFVYTSVAKDVSEELLKKLTNEQRGKLMLLENFNKIVGIKDDEALTILKPLILDKKAAVTKISLDFAIKIFKKEEKSVKITEVDIRVFQLEKNEEILKQNIASLETESDEALAQVRSSLKNNRKLMAKSWLRRKKELDKYIEKRANALDNVRSLLEKLKQTESDTLVLESYRLGIDALKQSLSENGLSEERADATMDELQDTLDVTKDIENCLSRPLDESSDADLEQELENLLKDESNPPGDSPGALFDINTLPDVPSTCDEKFEERLKSLSV